MVHIRPSFLHSGKLGRLVRCDVDKRVIEVLKCKIYNYSNNILLTVYYAIRQGDFSV